MINRMKAYLGNNRFLKVTLVLVVVFCVLLMWKYTLYRATSGVPAINRINAECMDGTAKSGKAFRREVCSKDSCLDAGTRSESHNGCLQTVCNICYKGERC